MRVHVLGVCGTFMAGVALLARELGHEVAGSDKGCYEPMAGQLRRAGVRWKAPRGGQLPPADLHIVGNAVSRGDPQLEAILRRGLPHCSGPEWLQREVLARRAKVVMVAGTHGKTTTSTMLVHVLERLGWRPGYLVGGLPAGGLPSARLGGKKVAVVEADEYDTACWDKRPKFAHYRADVAVLTNVEFDHADIYPDLAAVKRQFALLPRYLKPGGCLLRNARDRHSRAAVAPAPWYELAAYSDPQGLAIARKSLRDRRRGRDRRLPAAPPPGAHNRLNFLAAAAACERLGIPLAAAAAALADYELPARRLQRLAAAPCLLYDDFAHHPTAIAATLATLRELHPAQRITALLEPGSNTMRMGRWRTRLAPALRAADRVRVYAAGLDWDVAAALRPLGKRARIETDAARLQAELLRELRAGEVVVMLSNGSFGGLRETLPRALARIKKLPQ
ncbi:MAG: UDP-N-acetylmuramate:L-alanyl-gamma-D-glutamyl-meso-diaminopimelate ligase [Betaproteobacteria bacterium AqS2]|uniref:UDP-N-acetylmuramate:L-alanyl-gamma-D-glutamyl-meso-diaminopimelate ligase n=1 Tax=Candidatus Amphirhobacter heronislandensis TaxID=1732024 RepID=A0A930Y0Y9_9GAMM|nr:UDP-N-acetylmuramate:L-alanyl-gamma-D-glutamyl-meso-diaminopimelate ligase [Betaproteobacteria bacterium AqS2]